MKKFIVIAAIMLLVAVSAKAQLTVQPTGQVLLGRNWFEEQGFPPEFSDIDTITKIRNFGIDEWGNRARMSFGYQQFCNDLKVMIGNCYDTHDEYTIEALWLHGKYGFAITQNARANDTIVQFWHGENVVDVKYPIKSEGLLLTSDSRLKENVHPMEDALTTLSGLKGVTYNYKPRPAPNAGEVAVADYEVENKAYFDKYYADLEAARCSKTRYGFIAQEVEQVLPDVVETDKDGMKSVDYIAVIPILVNAVNELNARNQELEQQLRLLSEPKVSYAPAQQPTGVEDLLTDHTAEVLGQNDPNPFISDTRIDYRLPEGTQAAAIYIYNLQGQQVMQLPITIMEAGSVTINGGSLQPGMFIYALIADGKELGAKRMILTK